MGGGTIEPYYSDDYVTIYHGDCRDVLPVQCDAVITDPPYNDRTHIGAITAPIDFPPVSYTTLCDILSMQARLVRGWTILTLPYQYAFRMDAEPPAGLRAMRIGVWVKPNPSPQLSGDRPTQGWEAIAYLHGPGRATWNGGGRHGNYWTNKIIGDHPTQKPISVFGSLVGRFTAPADTIIDPFMGSGTTLRAAKDLGRKAIGIEIEERYCEIAAQRMQQEVLAL